MAPVRIVAPVNNLVVVFIFFLLSFTVISIAEKKKKYLNKELTLSKYLTNIYDCLIIQ